MAYWKSKGCVHSRISRGVRPNKLSHTANQYKQEDRRHHSLFLDINKEQVDDLSQIEENQKATEADRENLVMG